MAPPARGKKSAIALRAEIEPSSTQMIVGGVGAGKTTELLVAEPEIEAVPDMYARYVDVSQRHDLRKMDDGVLLVIAGVELAKLAPDQPKEVHEAKEQFRKWERGYVVSVPIEDDYPEDDDGEPRNYHYVHHPPVLEPPLPAFAPGTQEKLIFLRTLRAAITPHVVLILDSLDRMTDVDRFRRVVHQDVRALKAARVGLVLVGPARVLYGPDRAIADVFDHFTQQSAVDVTPASEGHGFLLRVLRKRASADMLPDPSCERLARASGGVMRDLMSLARRAGEEAYVEGSDVIKPKHVEAAVDAFGRTMFFGLRKPEIDKLQQLRTRGQFVPTTDDDIALVETRRVLEYVGPPSRFAVHPCIEALLAALAKAA